MVFSGFYPEEVSNSYKTERKNLEHTSGSPKGLHTGTSVKGAVVVN